MKQELLKGLSEEQIAKVKACKNSEDILKLAKEEGVELTNEQLEAVSGGVCADLVCPKCSSMNIKFRRENGYIHYECWNCDHRWSEVDD